MRRILKLLLAIVAGTGLLGIIVVLLQGADVAVLAPKGLIADQQKQLIIVATLLGLIIVIPVFIMLFTIAWRYREGNKKAAYAPEWENNRLIEGLWWGIPCVIILVLGWITWQSSHDLDPYKALDSKKDPVKIQVVALQWRWLFIYPDQKIASINEVRFPVDTPVEFSLTADAPMNAFWIPKLGGQVYAMSGMSSKLHLQASQIGEYEGSSSNISGNGFADMRFVAKVQNDDDFTRWMNVALTSPDALTNETYVNIAQPTKVREAHTYRVESPGLYDTIIKKYMGNHH